MKISIPNTNLVIKSHNPRPTGAPPPRFQQLSSSMRIIAHGLWAASGYLPLKLQRLRQHDRQTATPAPDTPGVPAQQYAHALTQPHAQPVPQPITQPRPPVASNSGTTRPLPAFSDNARVFLVDRAMRTLTPGIPTANVNAGTLLNAWHNLSQSIADALNSVPTKAIQEAPIENKETSEKSASTASGTARPASPPVAPRDTLESFDSFDSFVSFLPPPMFAEDRNSAEDTTPEAGNTSNAPESSDSDSSGTCNADLMPAHAMGLETSEEHSTSNAPESSDSDSSGSRKTDLIRIPVTDLGTTGERHTSDGLKSSDSDSSASHKADHKPPERRPFVPTRASTSRFIGMPGVMGKKERLLSPARLEKSLSSSSGGSSMTLASVEEALDYDDSREISGVTFAKTFEKLLKLPSNAPRVSGIVRQQLGQRLVTQQNQETSAQKIDREVVLTGEHRFMHAWLDTLNKKLIAKGIDPRANLHAQLQQQDKDIDEILRAAGDNAAKYADYSTFRQHGPGQRYTRIGDYVEAFERATKKRFKESILANFVPKAKETFDLIHNTMENIRGLKDILPHKRGLLAVDRRKLDLLDKHGTNAELAPDDAPQTRRKLDLLDKHGTSDSQLRMFICDYDRQYAHKALSGLCHAMRHEQPYSLDMIKSTHREMCAGSTNLDSGAVITTQGFSEQGMSYLLAGIDFTEDGRKDLRAFQSRIETMKQRFLSEHPDMAVSMKDSRIILEEGDSTILYGRTAMPEAFLDYCCTTWLTELQSALAQTNDPDMAARKRAIIQFCKDCENLHPFMNGNGRVFALALPLRYFNDLDNRFLPVLEYPGRVDGHSIDELVEQFDEAISFVNREWRRA